MVAAVQIHCVEVDTAVEVDIAAVEVVGVDCAVEEVDSGVYIAVGADIAARPVEVEVEVDCNYCTVAAEFVGQSAADCCYFVGCSNLCVETLQYWREHFGYHHHYFGLHLVLLLLLIVAAQGVHVGYLRGRVLTELDWVLKS